VLRFGTLTLTGLPLVFLPLHRNDRFPSSVLEPGSGSRHLYAGHHLGSKQVSPRFYPEVANSLGFDVAYTVSTLRQWFTCVRLSDPYMTCLATPFPVTFTTMALDQRSLRLFEACSYKPASEGRPPSLEQHRARFLTVLRVPGTHSPAVSQVTAPQRLRQLKIGQLPIRLFSLP
jgi:hypothetical protein